MAHINLLVINFVYTNRLSVTDKEGEVRFSPSTSTMVTFRKFLQHKESR